MKRPIMSKIKGSGMKIDMKKNVGSVTLSSEEAEGCSIKNASITTFILQMQPEEYVEEMKEKVIISGDFDILQIVSHEGESVARLFYKDGVLQFEGDASPAAKTFVDFMISYLNQNVSFKEVPQCVCGATRE